MPKIVDHEQRRHDIAAALWRVVGDQGPAAVSIRTVAAEAGWSTGALRHYFATRGELLTFAIEQSAIRVRERVHARAERPATESTVIERVAGFAEELLPLDDQRNAEFQLWLAFGGESARDREVATRLNAETRGLYRQLVGGLGGLEPPEVLGEPSDDPWLETWAEHLGVFVDGLSTQLVYTPEQMNSERARAVLREFLAAIMATVGVDAKG
ncbi:TetR family transcriptional regulator C-terminal domain-containing protein [Spiractinospora alimapuensis]|uniref:TetR/AcrR family transcriptional regulator n=1 Tax=Spiractinospora alimapuensis TaxID=2820884 RepID=UPI001F2EAB89|nr:TetR family transcriptional regulator C-terminal domain-containing protein [Spiractinospora alimapuensis]QVQ50137.1 TetR family transcriptional regulator C-terminal domain-containing protein [Spiractinospora alimapuensis]